MSDAWEAVRRADHPAVGLVLDTFHILARGTDLSAIRSIPRDRIFLVQAADAPKLDMDYLSWSRHFRNFPGQGDFPLDDFMDALAATGFDGLFSLEIFNDQFRSGSTRQVAVDGHRSLIYLLDRLYARNGQTLNELCDGLAMTRQAVTKHLGILEAANLVTTLRHGREKLHYINSVPIHQIGERWIRKFERGKLLALSELKRQLEKRDE